MYWEARVPAPQLTQFLIKSGDVSTIYVKPWAKLRSEHAMNTNDMNRTLPSEIKDFHLRGSYPLNQENQD